MLNHDWRLNIKNLNSDIDQGSSNIALHTQSLSLSLVCSQGSMGSCPLLLLFALAFGWAQDTSKLSGKICFYSI